MSQRAQELACRFEEVSESFAAEMAGYGPAQWRAYSAAEERTVAALARHVAWGFEVEMGVLQAIADGRAYDPLSDPMLARINAEDAATYADCDQAETVALIRQSAATVAAAVRGLTDEQLARSGVFLAEEEADSVAVWIEYVLIGHPGLHLPQIRAAAASVGAAS